MQTETLVGDTTSTGQSYEKFKPLISFMNLEALTDLVKAPARPLHTNQNVLDFKYRINTSNSPREILGRPLRK